MGRYAKAWVQVELEIDEDDLDGSARLDRFIAAAVDDGDADCLQVYSGSSMQGRPGAPELACGCGAKLDDLHEPCWKCQPEQNEWFWADHDQRSRDLAVGQ